MEINEKKSVEAIMILEIIGKPPEHLVKTLEDLTKQMDEEKGVSVKEKKIREPILMKDQKEFYTTHAEIEVEVEGIMHIMMLVFKYMPANIEILYPEKISLTNNDLSEIISEIARKLHAYDEVARVIHIEKNILEKKLKELIEEKKKEVEGK